ncbi:TPA: hypothetical protein QEK98_000221 [Stenotrophomonas maltophilia]|nr:hypothetical protein [Stenotrophomonas maltophilia]
MSQSYLSDTFKATPLKVGYLKVAVAPMPFFLVYTELDFTLELQLSADAQRRMHEQIIRLTAEGRVDTFKMRLSAELARVLPEQVDWDIKPPTPAQQALARSLALQLGSSIPIEARDSRFEMHRFISEQLLLTKEKRKGEGAS